MIHINLLPVRQIKQRLRVRNEVAFFVLSMVVLILLLASVAGKLYYNVNSLTGENKLLTAKKASYQPILEEIEKLKKDKKEQETKELIDDLFDHWSTIMTTEIASEKISSPVTSNLVTIFQQAINNPPMTGSAKIFWKNLYITCHHATKTTKPQS